MATQAEKSRATRMFESHPERRAAMSRSDLFEELKNKLRKVTIDEGDGTSQEYYLAEGDLLLDEDELIFYAARREQEERARAAAMEAASGGQGVSNLTEVPRFLVGITEDGKIVRWKDGTTLTYCVLKNTFATGVNNYESVREAMKKATEAWENTCGVKFEHRADLDTSNSIRPQGVLFTVREFDSGGQFIAAAFFPNDPTNRRRVLIDPSFYSPGSRFDKVGVLRHELGHALGFRHEHIRSGAPAVCPDEPLGNTVDLTQYDPQSVMHYFCGGVGTPELAISEFDKIGSQKVYGLPLSAYRFME